MDKQQHKAPRLLRVLILIAIVITCFLTFGFYRVPEAAAVAAHLNSTSTEQGFKIKYESDTRAQLIAPDVNYIRLYFQPRSIPKNVRIQVSDVNNQSSQHFDADTLETWSYSTAYFKGDTVIVDTVTESVMNLLKGVRVETDRDAKFLRTEAEEAPGVIVGPDDRVHSENPATARMEPIGCTGWLTSAGVGLSAGHCFCQNVEKGICQNPKPITTQQILQFDVPPSLPDGTEQPPPAKDQFPIDMGSIKFAEVGFDNGRDWAVFRIKPNTDGTSVFASRQAFFQLVKTAPAPEKGTYITVTGYGVDDKPPGTKGGNNAASQTEQEALGQILEVIDKENPSRRIFYYDADSSGGDSGGPLHLPGSLIAIGIHDGGYTNCKPPNCNYATGIANENLLNAIGALAPGDKAKFIDARSPSWVGEPNGTILQPYRTIEEALTQNILPQDLDIVAGYYAGRGLTINKASAKSATIYAVAGNVTIGPVPRPLPLGK
ncbi:MAG: trypsin-like serine protease [Cyanobacteria bacterium]|jgi:hypothetical protein|nr:trypsin-like serine protease [Cyanobacteria bacterium GSL.Bin1]